MLDRLFSIEDLAARLGAVPYFRGLNLEELTAIIAAGIVRRVGKGQMIFVEDEPQSGMYVLLSGEVQICKLSLSGQVSILRVLEPVVMFNEVAALDGGNNPVTAIALSDCLLWTLSSADLEKLILRYPHIGLGMLHVMAARNRYLVGAFSDLSFRTVLARSAKLLLEISEDGRKPIERRKHPNHQLAARIATVPEAFSRTLKTFRTEGLITASSKQITLIDPRRLRSIAEIGSMFE